MPEAVSSPSKRLAPCLRTRVPRAVATPSQAAPSPIVPPLPGHPASSLAMPAASSRTARLLAALSFVTPSASGPAFAAATAPALSLVTVQSAAASSAFAAPASWLARGAGVVSLVASSSCRRPEPPSITPHLVRIASVSPGGLDLDLQLQVHNPNSFPLAVEAVTGTLYGAQSQKLGVGRSNPKSSIPAGGSALVAFQLRVGWESVSAVAPLLAAERTPYTFGGDVTLGGESIHVTLPFTLTGELTRTQLLQAGLRGL